MRQRIIRSLVFSVIVMATLFLGSAKTAFAVSFGPDCGSGNCFGSVYTLVSQLVGSTTTTHTYDFLLSVNTAGYNGPGSGLDAVAIKTVAQDNHIVGTPLLQSAPSSFPSAGISGLNANGCGTGGNSGFICAQSTNLGGVPVPNAADYSFKFRTTIVSGALLPQNEWSIKALYVDSSGKQAGLTSVTGAVPIPGTLLLFVVPMIALVLWHSYHRANAV
ncbi:hypothetical protein [Candidatus Nitrospira bockiana]